MGEREQCPPAGIKAPPSGSALFAVAANETRELVQATGCRRRGKSWSSDEARKFLESAKAEDDPLYAAYALVLVTGLRKGEALGLTWENVDLDAGEPTIGRQLQRVRGQLLHPRHQDPGVRRHPSPARHLPDRSQAQTRTTRRGTSSRRQHLAGNRPRIHHPLCAPIEPRNFQRSWQTPCEKASVKPITVHDARRTCATLLADLDVHPRVAMQVLRHARFSVTMEIYTQVSTKATRDALKRLGDSLGR
ncbi:site-specific integrase [Micromonospora sp. MSM11]|nr:site-specific integrase [Micromonospora sp. MSM11]MCL7459954.1 site-specific integrase [Micromonospora sp. MSM11]